MGSFLTPPGGGAAPSGPKIAYGFFDVVGLTVVFGTGIASVTNTGGGNRTVVFTPGYFSTSHIAVSIQIASGGMAVTQAADITSVSNGAGGVVIQLPSSFSFYLIAIGS